MDSGFDSKEADRFFDHRKKEQEYNELERLKKENFRLAELILNLKKDGFTYDQVNRKMIVCEACGKNIKENIK